ncbi:hypothetical protein SESBI_19496 [Sesbania bispinosa]|nr:hypothetical protein SESBI_19496 [Sesbania bispinosa]
MLFQTDIQLNEEVSASGPSGRRPDISLQVPPRPLGFGSTCGGRVLDHSQSFFKGISSSRGFLRALSFKRKGNVADGERSSLLNSDPKTAANCPNMASISEIAWTRCTSLPVTLHQICPLQFLHLFLQGHIMNRLSHKLTGTIYSENMPLLSLSAIKLEKVFSTVTSLDLEAIDSVVSDVDTGKEAKPSFYLKGLG